MRLRATVGASLLMLGTLCGGSAHALALGRVAVQSALGQPLRAEVEVPQLTAEEAQSLKVSIGGTDAYSQARLEYSPLARSLRVTPVIQPNGRSILRLSSDQPINEPFVDVVIDAQWAGGRIVRGYSLLLDPVAAASTPAPVVAQAPQISAPVAVAPVQRPVPVTATPMAPATPAVTARRQRVEPAPRKAAPTGESITVQRGDTAGQIAAAAKADGVSLDQMLLALLQNNRHAFINGDINRVRTGAVLQLPSAEQALAVSTPNARRQLQVSSRNFGQYRRKLAKHSPVTVTPAASVASSGQVQTQVKDATEPTTADKLTLSKGSVQGQKAGATAEKQVADRLRQEEQANRDAELKRNMGDLAKLKDAASGAAATGTAATAVAASAPGINVPVAAAPVVPSSAPAAAPASAPVVAASAPASAPVPPVQPASAAKPKITVAPPPPVAEPSLMDSLMENPLLPAAGVGLLALLGGYGYYRSRQRKLAEEEAMEDLGGPSSLKSDSVFTASGGQQINTQEAGGDSMLSGSSMSFSPSQLDAGDVDPVAEADVYIGYGRDAQAEEILREALIAQPDRLAIHSKLLDIYAKRADTQAFQTHALEVRRLTNGEGAEWQRVCAMGNSIEPGLPLYQIGSPAAANAAVVAPVAAAAAASAAAMAAAPGVQVVPTPPAVPAPPMPDHIAALDLSLESGFSGLKTGASEQQPSAAGPDSVFTLDDTPSDIKPNKESEFDVGTLSLLPAHAPEPPPLDTPSMLPGAGSDAMNTKLELAQAFADMGENQGARDLLREVMAHGDESQKAKAQLMLGRLS